MQSRTGYSLFFLVLAIGLLISGDRAIATDNTTPYYWASRPVSWKFDPNQPVPSSWHGAIRQAVDQWHSRTALTFTESSSSINSVFRGPIPSSWQAGCDPGAAIACTRYTYNASSNQLYEVDTVFNSNFPMGTNGTLCALSGPPNNLNTIDVQTVALHEFGHWGVLGHTSDIQAIMFATYKGCQRTLSQHDVDSMNAQYAGR